MAKIGRNDPCPCGSGKKYKKCCLGKHQSTNTSMLYRRLSDAHDRLSEDLMRYARATFGDIGLELAEAEYFLWPDEPPDEDIFELNAQAFWPWFLFNWYFDPLELDGDESEEFIDLPAMKTIAELYMQKKGNRINQLEKQIIYATNRVPYSFYEVLNVQPGIGMDVKDILTGNTAGLTEHSGSEKLEKGDILFARIARIGEVSMLVGCSMMRFPPSRKLDVIALRKMMKQAHPIIDHDVLSDFDTEIREVYLDLVDAAFEMPKLCNTDDDPICFQTLYFDIDSPDMALEKLKSLSVVETDEELREAAERDENGKIVKSEITWSRKGYKTSETFDNTTLGHILIDGNKLRVEVNSEQRAERIQDEIRSRLGGHARYRTRKIQDPKAMLNRMKPEDKTDIPDQGEDLMQYPEVREKLAGMLAGHWKNWVDMKLPALGGKTPRQAVKTPDGREAVEALILDAERRMSMDRIMRDSSGQILHDVRLTLGLED